MYTSYPFSALALGAALVAATDLGGFQTSLEPTLLVAFGQTAAMGGVEVAKDATAQQPLIAVASQTPATSLAILMVDLDIPSSTQPTTFLHWMQMGLTVAPEVSTMMTSEGPMQGFAVNTASNTSVAVPYTPPNPPAMAPLSHRYAQMLIDTSAAPETAVVILQTAAQSPVNFNIAVVLQQAGLSESVVAWNMFNVTNQAAAEPAAAAPAAAAPEVAAANSSSNAAAAMPAAEQAMPPAAAEHPSNATAASENQASNSGSEASQSEGAAAAGAVSQANTTAAAPGAGSVVIIAIGAGGAPAPASTAASSPARTGGEAPYSMGNSTGTLSAGSAAASGLRASNSSSSGSRAPVTTAAATGRYSFVPEVLALCVLGAMVFGS